MRRVDPTDPEYPYQPEPGSDEWIELRQEQTRTDGGTRRFQPHRADGKRSERTRRTLPDAWIPALAGMALVYNIAQINVPFMGWGDLGLVIRAALIFIGFAFLFTYLRRMLLWLKDKD